LEKYYYKTVIFNAGNYVSLGEGFLLSSYGTWLNISVVDPDPH
jgi:hypothetical protein